MCIRDRLYTGINPKHISSTCLGKRKTCGGFIWEYDKKFSKEKKNGLPLENNNNYLITKDGRVFSKRANKYLKPKIDPDGYLLVSISTNNVNKQISIHRLVAMTYIENPNNYPYVNHIDNNKQNNNITNLEWCTPKQNMIHHIKTRTKIYTVKVAQYDMNYNVITSYASIKEAGEKTGIDKSSIVRVCKGKQKYAGKYIWSYIN